MAAGRLDAPRKVIQLKAYIVLVEIVTPGEIVDTTSSNSIVSPGEIVDTTSSSNSIESPGGMVDTTNCSFFQKHSYIRQT